MRVQQDKPMERDPKEPRDFLVVPSMVIGHMILAPGLHRGLQSASSQSD